MADLNCHKYFCNYLKYLIFQISFGSNRNESETNWPCLILKTIHPPPCEITKWYNRWNHSSDWSLHPSAGFIRCVEDPWSLLTVSSLCTCCCRFGTFPISMHYLVSKGVRQRTYVVSELRYSIVSVNQFVIVTTKLMYCRCLWYMSFKIHLCNKYIICFKHLVNCVFT